MRVTLNDMVSSNSVKSQQNTTKYRPSILLKEFQATSAKIVDVEIIYICHFHFRSVKLVKKFANDIHHFSGNFRMPIKMTNMKFPYIRHSDFTSDKADVPASFRKNWDHGHISWELQSVHGLVQNCSNSSALAMELLQSCTKPSMQCLTNSKSPEVNVSSSIVLHSFFTLSFTFLTSRAEE